MNPGNADYRGGIPTSPTSSGSADSAPEADGAFKRRAIVQGAAWSVPILAAAMATPAHAASPRCLVPLQMFEAVSTNVNVATALPAVTATAPALATRMHFVVVGGNGAANFTRGANIEGDMAVTPGQQFALQAGAGGEYAGATGRGGKSLFGNGGDGSNSNGVRGYGGGGASALLMAGTPILVAGGGGGGHTNQYPNAGSDAARFSGSLSVNTTASYGGAAPVSALAGNGNAGTTASSLAGLTGYLGWAGNKPAVTGTPTSAQIALMSGGGSGGGAAAGAPGAGGIPAWVSSPSLTGITSANGAAGSARNGGAGATLNAVALSGGGGGGWSGGGGGSLSRITSWTGPNPDTYDGRYDIGSTGGGGSSHTNGAFTNLTAVSDTRAVNTGGNGNNGYVRVTFYRC